MIGLALGGGGTRGSYQIGVFLALKKCHIRIDGFVGTSIGAFNAAMLASKREKELLNFWQTVDVATILGENDVKSIISNKGISTDAMYEVLKSLDISSTLYKSKKDFGLVTVRLKDIKPLYLLKKDIKPNLLNEYIIASCYLPIFKLEKIIDDSYYLDGSIFDVMPVNMLLNKGYDKIYAVDLQSFGIKRKYDKSKVILIKPSKRLGSILNKDKDKIRENIKLGYYDTLKIIKKYDGYKYLFKKVGNWYYQLLLRKVSKRIRKNMEKMFKTDNPKELMLKALEYVMLRENISYYNIYSPYQVVKLLRNKKSYGVYRFINEIHLM